MRKSIELSLQYRENGNDGCLSVTIDFISNHVIRTYADINRDLTEFVTIWNDLSNKRSKLSALMTEGSSADSGEVKKISQEIIDDTEKLTAKKYETFTDRRFELIKLILKDNKINEERLFTAEFWDNCVDPSDMNEFLDQAVSKDISKKKPNLTRPLFTTTA